MSLPNGEHVLEPIVCHKATFLRPAITQHFAMMGLRSNVTSAIKLTQGVSNGTSPRRHALP